MRPHRSMKNSVPLCKHYLIDATNKGYTAIGVVRNCTIVVDPSVRLRTTQSSLTRAVRLRAAPTYCTKSIGVVY